MRVLRVRGLRGLCEITRRRTRNAQVNGSNPFAGSSKIEVSEHRFTA